MWLPSGPHRGDGQEERGVGSLAADNYRQAEHALRGQVGTLRPPQLAARPPSTQRRRRGGRASSSGLACAGAIVHTIDPGLDLADRWVSHADFECELRYPVHAINE